MDPLSLPFSTYGLVIFLFLMCLFYLFYKFGCAPYTVFTKQGIPGPKPKPFIGSLDLIGKFEGNTIKMNSFLVKEYGPVSGIYFGAKPFLYITDLNMIREVTVKQFDKFVDRTEKSGGLQVFVQGQKYSGVFSSSGDDWRRHRHYISPAFSAHKMKLMEPLIKESTVRLAKKIAEHARNVDSVDLYNMYGQFTMEVILSTAFGRSLDVQGGNGGKVYEDARDMFQSLSGKWAVPMRIVQFLLFSTPWIAPLLGPLLRMSGAFGTLPRVTETAIKMVEMRRKEGDVTSKKDLLQLMVDTQDNENKKGLSTGEIVADAVGFLFAGHETTSVALTFATYLLATQPEVQEKLFNEIHDYFDDNPDKSMYDATHDLSYLDNVFSETLRLYPSAPGTARLCNEDCVINGISIKAGMQVFIPIYDVHRDPEVWPEPEKFIPERFTPEEKAKRHPCAYLPFGFGPRNCVGMRFALMEAKMALIEVVRNFRIELSPETKTPVEPMIQVSMKPKDKVFVTFHARE